MRKKNKDKCADIPDVDTKELLRCMENDDFRQELQDSLLKYFDKMPDTQKASFLDNFKETTASICHITTEEWQETHPSSLACGSDKYYVGLVNRMIDKLYDFIMPNAPENIHRWLALSVAAYLEDIVNDFGVWKAFRNIYRQTYDTWLPFYDCEHDEYMLDNVNIEDLKFIVWQANCRCAQQEGRTFSPYSPGYTPLAETLFDLIVDEFEKAPESERIGRYIDSCLKSQDYGKVRDIALWISVRNPLTAVPDKLLEMEMSTEEYVDKDIPLYGAMNQVTADESWQRYVGPLGIGTHQWLARMCHDKGFDKAAECLEAFKIRDFQTYSIIKRSRDYLEIKDFHNTTYKVGRKSFGKILSGESSIPDDRNQYTTSIAYFNGLWHQNGIATYGEDSLDKTSQPSMLSLYDDKIYDVESKVISDHDGQQVFICKTLEEISEIMQGLAPIPINQDETLDPGKGFALFVSHEAPPQIMSDGAPLFKIKGNRRYSKKVSDQEGLRVIFAGLPDDVADYIQKNDLAPDIQIYASQGKQLGKAVVQDNFRFLCGFYRTKEADI